jgi:hypothetical protein
MGFMLSWHYWLSRQADDNRHKLSFTGADKKMDPCKPACPFFNEEL